MQALISALNPAIAILCAVNLLWHLRALTPMRALNAKARIGKIVPDARGNAAICAIALSTIAVLALAALAMEHAYLAFAAVPAAFCAAMMLIDPSGRAMGMDAMLPYFQVLPFAGAMVGALMGFLRFNANPARVFMGDVGSFFIGGALAGMALVTRLTLLLPIIALAMLVSSLSDIIQVSYF